MDSEQHAAGCQALVKNGHTHCLRCAQNENASLRDAIAALRDFIEGKRHDHENITAILNGALRAK